MGEPQDISTKAGREQFIKSNLPFIRKTAISQSGRLLQWGRDDELSIALIAFDAAIDTHSPGKGMSFHPYARMVIKRRLIDYYRSQARQKREFPAGDHIADLADNTSDLETGLDDFLTQQRKEEISLFIQNLRDYEIQLTDLVKQAPKREALRNTLLEVVKQISHNEHLHTQILKTGRLPLHEVSALTKVSESVLSKRRKYLLALLTIELHAADFPFISTYVNKGGQKK